MRILADSRLTVGLKLSIYRVLLQPYATSVMTRIAVFLVLGTLSLGSANAQVHKCVDVQGRIIYSQDPCPANTKSGTVTRRVDRPASTPGAAAAPGAADKAAKGDGAKKSGPKTAADLEQDFRKRQQDQAKEAKESADKSAEAQRKQDNCRAARERLANYEIGGRMTRVNPQGERYYLEDAQIEREKAQARADVAQACN
jgi:Skp family chaperone for outer membrane proteins